MAELSLVAPQGCYRFSGLTAAQCQRLFINGENVGDYEFKIVAPKTSHGHDSDSRELTLNVGDFRRVNNNPEAIAKAVKEGRSFYVALGQDKYLRDSRNYDVYLGLNDFEILEDKTEEIDHGDTIETRRVTAVKPKAGRVGCCVYDFIPSEKIIGTWEWKDIGEQIEKTRNETLRENLKKAAECGAKYVRFGNVKTLGDSFVATTHIKTTAKPEKARRIKLSEELKEKANIDLPEWKIKYLEEAGFKIIKARKKA